MNTSLCFSYSFHCNTIIITWRVGNIPQSSRTILMEELSVYTLVRIYAPYSLPNCGTPFHTSFVDCFLKPLPHPQLLFSLWYSSNLRRLEAAKENKKNHRHIKSVFCIVLCLSKCHSSLCVTDNKTFWDIALVKILKLQIRL